MVDLKSPRVPGSTWSSDGRPRVSTGIPVNSVTRRKVTPSQSSKGIRVSGKNKVKELKDRTILNTTQFAIYVSRLRHQENLPSRPTCSGEGIYLAPPLKTVTRFDPSADRTTGYIWPVVRRVATPPITRYRKRSPNLAVPEHSKGQAVNTPEEHYKEGKARVNKLPEDTSTKEKARVNKSPEEFGTKSTLDQVDRVATYRYTE